MCTVAVWICFFGLWLVYVFGFWIFPYGLQHQYCFDGWVLWVWAVVVICSIACLDNSLELVIFIILSVYQKKEMEVLQQKCINNVQN